MKVDLRRSVTSEQFGQCIFGRGAMLVKLREKLLDIGVEYSNIGVELDHLDVERAQLLPCK